jgi:hypothetical protein
MMEGACEFQSKSAEMLDVLNLGSEAMQKAGSDAESRTMRCKG